MKDYLYKDFINYSKIKSLLLLLFIIIIIYYYYYFLLKYI